MGVAHSAMKKPSEPIKLLHENQDAKKQKSSEPIHSQPGNPGTWDELHKKATDLCPINIQGFQITLGKPLNKHLLVNHVLTFSNITPSGYSFEGHYTGGKKIGFSETYPKIKGSIVPYNGNLKGSFVHALGCRWRLKFATQIDKKKYLNSTSVLEYRSDDFTISTKLANVDFLKNHGTLKVQYLQTLSPRLTLGGEVMCQRESNHLYGYQTSLSVAGRYSWGPRTIAATLGNNGLHLSYHHVASDQLQLGVELETDMKLHHTSGQIVYQVDLPEDDILFKGIITSERSIGGVLEKKISPLKNSSLLLSVFVNQNTKKLFVGIGFNVK